MNIAGYASIFNVPDSGGDVVRPGAFARSLAAGSPVPLLWNHNARSPIGTIHALREDARGLLVEASIIDGLSFGYRVRAARIDRAQGLRELLDLELLEVSLVDCPMHKQARLVRR